MLKFLQIENVAVIERAELPFDGRFSVLTGETGAGKSIIIDAINTVLGQRVSKDVIRTGCEQVSISAVFDRLPESAVCLLRENGYEPDENGDLILRRILQRNGNGSIRIGDRPATAGFLREVGQELLDIHGQHDSQRLLDPKKHVDYLDKLAENEPLKEQYAAEFQHLNTVRRRLQELERDESDKQRRMDLLSYQIEELRNAELKIGEIAELKQKLSIAENYQKILRHMEDAYFYLNGDDDRDGAAELIKKAQSDLSAVAEKAAQQSAERLSEVLSLLEETCISIRDFNENGSYAELNTEELRARLDFLHKLMVKYGNTEEEMLSFLRDAENEWNSFAHSEEEMQELSAELQKSTDRLVALGERLTASRKTAAERFSNQVTAVLRDLDMPRVAFCVSFQKGRYTKNGCDETEFLISANEGESVRPLSKIASGGELSRVMLAIKSVLAEKDEVPTLIFDEIDTGISGHAAYKVGQLIRAVSQSHQVLCVTHLAQIAAFADEHFLIEKSTEQHRTVTHVRVLDESQRVGEIARIMSGTELTENLMNSAKELLDRSKRNDTL